ncbi:MAG: hypothetical protein P1S60_18370, partial [Anaerolineae bacterium]|nr:hypothetical protein [Anaerolineae bacterium]
MSVFDPKVFANAPKLFRPLKIIHGLDRYLGEKGVGIGLSDQDPAGQWASWVATQDIQLTDDQVAGLRQYLQTLDRLGVGGIVTNVGFQDYLESPLQWEILRQGLAIAQALGLRVWLYDEQGYPSGTAGGKVLRANPEFAARGLACYVIQVSGPQRIHFPLPISCKSAVGAFTTLTPDIATGDRGIDLSDYIDVWDNLVWDAPEGEWTVLFFAERVMYEGTHAQGNVSEFKQYVNLLDPAATRAFLRSTHEAYYREIPPELWQTVEAIFTDEPSFMCYYVPALPERFQGKVAVGDKPRFKDRPMAVPWMRGFEEAFRQRQGYDLKPYYYALFFSQSEEACYVRQHYYEVLTATYADAFYRQIQEWCAMHGIASSGHLLLEENILDHVIFHGSLFQPVRYMDVPGLDMLSSDPAGLVHGGSFMGDSFMGIKQITSIAHLSGNDRVHSESSDWEQRNQGGYATLQQRFGQANVQYALGVNQITSYFGWQELGTDAQRQYNDYVGRLGSLLTGGQHVCDVAVLYPLRTLWAHYVPPLKPIPSWMHRPERSPWETEVPQAYAETVKTLLCHQIDMDIIDETALVNGRIDEGVLASGDEAYRVLVCPPIDALSLDAARAMQSFCESGGILICVGSQPRLAETKAHTAALRDIVDGLFSEDGGGYVITLNQLVETIRQHIPADVRLPKVDD